MIDERLEALFGIARRVRDSSDALGVEVRAGLRAMSSLSTEGIELALTEHLEVDATEAQRASLRAWCRAGRTAGSPPATTCHVVLSAHVCTAALRAIAIALESAANVVVKPSRRDPVLAEVLVRELARAGISICVATDIDPARHDEVHAYGADVTLDAIHGSLPEGVRFRGHGSGFGLACVGPNDSIDDAASALARDVVPFDQRGCLSPRVVLVPDVARATAFADALDRSLGAAAFSVPRGALAPDERAELAVFTRTCEALGEVLAGPEHTIALAEDLDRIFLPPTTRAVLVAVVEPSKAHCVVGPLTRYLTTIGGNAEAIDAYAAAMDPADRLASARRAPLGSMQRPPLDGPVDRRQSTMTE